MFLSKNKNTDGDYCSARPAFYCPGFTLYLSDFARYFCDFALYVFDFALYFSGLTSSFLTSPSLLDFPDVPSKNITAFLPAPCRKSSQKCQVSTTATSQTSFLQGSEEHALLEKSNTVCWSAFFALQLTASSDKGFRAGRCSFIAFSVSATM